MNGKGGNDRSSKDVAGRHRDHGLRPPWSSSSKRLLRVKSSAFFGSSRKPKRGMPLCLKHHWRMLGPQDATKGQAGQKQNPQGEPSWSGLLEQRI